MVDIVDIGLKVDSRSVDKGRKSLDKFGKQSKATQGATDKLTSSLKSLASAAALAVIANKVINSHREFTKSISELSAITGATGRDLRFYSEEAKRLGSTTTFAASEVAQAFKLVASAKPDLLESKEALAAVTRETLTLAEAAGMDLPSAANALGSSLNQFSADADEATKFINVLAAGAKFGASEINNTSEALKNSGAVAASLGLSFEQTNAAIQALASVSIKGAEAGTGLRGVLLKLSTQARDEFNPEIVGLETALKNLSDANLTTTEKSKLFGQESITAATALIKQADAVGELTKKLTGTNTATEQAATNTNNLDGDIKAFNSAVEGLSLTLGEELDPALRGIIQTGTDLLKPIKQLILEFADLGDTIGFIAAFGSLDVLDFDGMSAMIDARKAERAEVEAKIAAIWEEKAATDALNESKGADPATAAATEQSAITGGETETERMSRIAEEEAAIQADIDANKVLAFAFKEAAMEEMRQAAFDKEWAMIEAQAEHEEEVFRIRMRNQSALDKFKEKSTKDQTKQVLGELVNITQGSARESRAMFEANKAAATANAVMNTWQGASKTMAEYPYPYNLILAGLSLASGFAQVSAIQSTSFGGGGGGGGSVSGASGIPSLAGTVPESAAPITPEEAPTNTTEIVVSGGLHTDDDVRMLIERINEVQVDTGSQTQLVAVMR